LGSCVELLSDVIDSKDNRLVPKEKFAVKPNSTIQSYSENGNVAEIQTYDAIVRCTDDRDPQPISIPFELQSSQSKKYICEDCSHQKKSGTIEAYPPIIIKECKHGCENGACKPTQDEVDPEPAIDTWSYPIRYEGRYTNIFE
jgi:hypothetical protein